MEFSVATRVFLTDRTNRGCNPATVRWYRDVLGLFERDSGVLRVEDVTTDTLRAYVVHLQAHGEGRRNARMSSVTIRKRTLALKTFFGWASHAVPELKAIDPAASLAAPRAPRRLPRAMSPDQARSLLAVPMSERDKAIIYLLLDTGIRLSECLMLDLSDVDESQGTLLIRVGKGGKQRMVVFESETRDALRLWLSERGKWRVKDYDALFVSEREGTRMTRYGLYKAVKRIAVKAGLAEVVSPHKIRHTMASIYLDAGGGIQDLSELLGHTEVSTTWIYTRISVAGLRRKHIKMSPLKQLQ